MNMALKLHVDETTCGPMCQHPACWQSNTRQDKGFPRYHSRPPSPPELDLDLPTVKVCNMLEDYGESTLDLYPAKFSGRPHHERFNMMPELTKPLRQQSVKMTRVPQPSPKSSMNGTQQSIKPGSTFKVVEVQELFDREDLQGTWDDTFVSKSYYVWMPNNKKKKRNRKKILKGVDESNSKTNLVGTKVDPIVKFKDMTEDMVPKEIEESRLTARKKRSRARSPTGLRPWTMTPRTTQGSSKMEFDHEGTRTSGGISVPVPTRLSGWHSHRSNDTGHVVFLSISELLDLPRDVLIQVLENSRQSDLMSREKIREIIKRYMPPQLDRGLTNVSMTSNDLLQQKKLNLHEGNKNLRQPQLMETKPVFYMDDEVMDEDEDNERSGSVYGSLKDLFLGTTGATREYAKLYKKPLPSISGPGRAVSAGEATSSKIPSISLGLPELPSGMRQTKAFTYNKKTDFDFTLAAMPTPPTSFRSTGTPGSDHGTTIRVNVPSQASMLSEHGSQERDEHGEIIGQTRDDPLHAVSPTLSTRVPLAPASTPAYYPKSPSKSAPLLRDTTNSTMPNTPQDWPPSREKMGSPLNIIRAPVNTPGSVMQEQAALGTIQEAPTYDEYTDQALPVSRQRSVRFEIPEVPPPPSSPQLSEKESLDDNTKDPSRNTVTVNTIIPKETPSSSSNYKPASGQTIRTDVTTFNTSSLNAEHSFAKSTTNGPVRELSLVSSPEPWPQVNEADFDVAPQPSPETSLHASPQLANQRDPNAKMPKEGNHSRNANGGSPNMTSPIKIPSPEKDVDNSEYVNKTVEPSSAVKKIMEEARKSESPAPPPPSPEAKEEDEIRIINSAKPKNVAMTPVLEESEAIQTPADERPESTTMTVMQIPPTGQNGGNHHGNRRQIDTFTNIDIPASSDLADLSQSANLKAELENETIIEEPEPSPEETKTRDIALSVQSTLANRTISERVDSEMTGSMIEPAMSQASRGPALSEDFSEKKEGSELFGDWTGIVVGSDSQDTQAMLSSEKQELDMTEDGGDHEGFKEDLRQEYEKLKKETSEFSSITTT